MATTYQTAEPFLPSRLSLKSLRSAVDSCEGCELFRFATQAVFGEGNRSARMFVLGEMPGDREDIEGRPFVGPAGRLLDEAFAEAGIDRHDVYVTNAVKHFRWEERGKRRLHKKPSARQIEACRPWLQAELLVIAPQALVCLGATAAQAVIGKSFRITRERGKLLRPDSPWNVVATWHPAAILRSPDRDARRRMRDELVGDLRTAARSF
jgi:DNA polymerase